MPVMGIDGVDVGLGGGLVIGQHRHQSSGPDIRRDREVTDPDEADTGEGGTMQGEAAVGLEVAGDVDPPRLAGPFEFPSVQACRIA